MKTIIKYLFCLAFSVAITNCSNDDENITEENQEPNPNPNTEVVDIPMENLSAIGAIEKVGFPKEVRKFENGILSYWAHYYYKADGNLLKINYSYSNSASNAFVYKYRYNEEGKIVKLESWDLFNFFWENNRIIKVEGYNGAWYGRYHMFYDYNDQGQIIKKSTTWLDTTPVGYDKTNYTYFPDGNLMSMDYYWYDYDTNSYVQYGKTNFTNYVASKNLFLELEIIPGFSEQFQFPGTREFKHFLSTGYDTYETYNYQYDDKGRVTVKTYGNTKILYQYY